MLDDIQTAMPGKGTLKAGEPHDGKKEPGQSATSELRRQRKEDQGY